jgi:hypothetical protein
MTVLPYCHQVVLIPSYSNVTSHLSVEFDPSYMLPSIEMLPWSLTIPDDLCGHCQIVSWYWLLTDTRANPRIDPSMDQCVGTDFSQDQ